MKLDKIVPWGRNLSEYKNMFLLNEKEIINYKILDVAGGPSSFNCEVNEKGGNVVSYDPLYMYSSQIIKPKINETAEIVLKEIEKNREKYNWINIKNPNELLRIRLEAMKKFLKHYEINPNRYIYGELPIISFNNNSFDLVLCSHFLFLYSNILYLNFHIESINEMLRVGKEVRIFPIVDLNNKKYKYLEKIIEIFEKDYFIELKESNYNFQKNAKEMLIIKRKISLEFINEGLLNEIVSIKKDDCYSSYGKIHKLIKNYELEESLKIFTLYYYGRGFLDGSLSETTSFFDILNDFRLEKISRKEIACKIDSVAFEVFVDCIKIAKEKFHEHEKNINKKKKELKKRLNSYKKKNKNDYKNKKRRSCFSRLEDFLETKDKFKIDYTEDISEAKEIINDIIKKTDGNIIVDFLGSENFDHLEYVECDDEILKLYIDYSNLSERDLWFPHNRRVDIAFERLEFIKYGNNIGIILKGFYRDKNWIKNYYNNKEKVRRVYNVLEFKHSHFYYEINFDKKQNGGIENFEIYFLPWRYFNILISPQEKLPSVKDTSRILILKNLIDIERKAKETLLKYLKFIIDNNV